MSALLSASSIIYFLWLINSIRLLGLGNINSYKISVKRPTFNKCLFWRNEPTIPKEKVREKRVFYGFDDVAIILENLGWS